MSSSVEAEASVGDRGGAAKIYRDRYGVPHVFGETLEAGYFGLGYASAQDRPKTLPWHQLAVQGRLAERLGNRSLPDPELPFLDGLLATPFFSAYAGSSFDFVDLLSVDRWMRLWGYAERAEESLSNLGDRSRSIIEAFCAGVNTYYARAGGEVLEEPYLPATEVAWWLEYEHTISMAFFISNAFALGPSKTEDGSVVVAGDPHYWFLGGHSEAHLEAPGFRLFGVWDGHVNLAFWGGGSDRLAIAITACGLEASTVYRERVNSRDREEYWDARAGVYTQVTQRPHLIQRRGEDPVEWIARQTHHGPIIGERLEHGDPFAYAVRSPYLEDPAAALDQQLRRWECGSVQEFFRFAEEAPFARGNLVVGDRGGNIGFVSNGPLAVRDATYDWGKPVPGDLVATEWAHERWSPAPGATHRLPAFMNPHSGFIQSANDAPACTTIDYMGPEVFPEYVFPGPFGKPGSRGCRQRQLLAGSGPLTLERAERVLFDTWVPRAALGIKALRAVAQRGGHLESLSEDARHVDALLDAWDGHASRDSIGMTLALHLYRSLAEGLPQLEMELVDDPAAESEYRVPDVDPAQAREYAAGLEDVAGTMLKLYGTLEKPWSEVHAVQKREALYPVPGGCKELMALFGTYRGWWTAPEELDEHGIEWVDFGSRTLRITVLRPERIATYSVSLAGQVPEHEDPRSPHVTDQAELYARCQLKELNLEIEAIEQEARASDHAACNHDSIEEVLFSDLR